MPYGLSRNAAQLGGGADFGPASDTLTCTFPAWAEAAHLGTLNRPKHKIQGAMS